MASDGTKGGMGHFFSPSRRFCPLHFPQLEEKMAKKTQSFLAFFFILPPPPLTHLSSSMPLTKITVLSLHSYGPMQLCLVRSTVQTYDNANSPMEKSLNFIYGKSLEFLMVKT